MKVLGIDPGTHRIGWGVIDGTPSSHNALAFGCIELPKHTTLDIYLKNTYIKINEILNLHKPDLVGIESLFFQKNKKTAIMVAQSRGVIMLSLAQNSLPIKEFAPNTVKSAVAGNGAASKKDVLHMVSLLLDLDSDEMLDDTADALAVAITAITIGA